MRRRTLSLRGSFTTLMLAPGALWLLLLFVVPLGLVVAMSFGSSNGVGQPIYGWHPANYKTVLNPIFLPVLERSLGYALAATAITLLLGYTSAYVLARYGGKHRHQLIILFVAPLFVDYLLRIYAWTVILNGQGFVASLARHLSLINTDGTLLGHTWTVILGLTYDFLPLMVLPAYVAIDRLDPSVLEAGRDLYGTAWATFRKITLPLTAQGIAAGCLLVFLSSVGDFATAQLLGGPGNYMVGNLIQDEFAGAAAVPVGAGLTTVLMLLMSILVVGYARRGRGSLRALAG
jgi:spermidine/putrescine transport system permease protein